MKSIVFTDRIRHLINRRQNTIQLFVIIVSLVLASWLGYRAYDAWWGAAVFFAITYVCYGVKRFLFAAVPHSAGVVGILEACLGLYLVYLAISAPVKSIIPIVGLVSHPWLGALLFFSLSHLGCRQEILSIYAKKLNELNTITVMCLKIGAYENCQTSCALAALKTAKLFGPCQLLYSILYNYAALYEFQGKHDAAAELGCLMDEVKALIPRGVDESLNVYR
ncbi:MAG: hypothetical protein ACYC1M_01705 [Armatimonadota bacterium]